MEARPQYKNGWQESATLNTSLPNLADSVTQKPLAIMDLLASLCDISHSPGWVLQELGEQYCAGNSHLKRTVQNDKAGSNISEWHGKIAWKRSLGLRFISCHEGLSGLNEQSKRISRHSCCFRPGPKNPVHKDTSPPLDMLPLSLLCQSKYRNNQPLNLHRVPNRMDRPFPMMVANRNGPPLLDDGSKLRHASTVKIC